MTCNNTGARGFTLIEIIVAISILSILVTLVTSELRTGLQASVALRQREDSLDQEERARTSLELQLRGVLPVMWWQGEGSDRHSYLDFEGDSSSVRFISQASFVDGPLSLPRWVELSWNRRFGDPTGLLSVTERRILSPDNQPDSQIYWSGPILNAQDLKFDYLRHAKNGKPPEWVPNWTVSEGRELPAAIRFAYTKNQQPSTLIIPIETAITSWKGLSLK